MFLPATPLLEQAQKGDVQPAQAPSTYVTYMHMCLKHVPNINHVNDSWEYIDLGFHMFRVFNNLEE